MRRFIAACTPWFTRAAWNPVEELDLVDARTGRNDHSKVMGLYAHTAAGLFLLAELLITRQPVAVTKFVVWLVSLFGWIGLRTFLSRWRGTDNTSAETTNAVERSESREVIETHTWTHDGETQSDREHEEVR